MPVWLLRLGVLGLLVLLWQALSGLAPRNLIPAPAETLLAFLRLWQEGRLGTALGESLRVYLLGLGAAAVVGILAGLVMGAWRKLGQVLEIFVYALAATPRVAFIPLVIALLGLGVEAKSFIIFLGAVMPVVMNTYAGVRAADPELIEMAEDTGASQARIFAHVILPGALPFLVVGLRLGATIGLINTVVAELYTAVKGLGGLLAIYGNTFRMAEYFAVVLTLSLVGVCVSESLRLLEQRLSRWQSRGVNEGK